MRRYAPSPTRFDAINVTPLIDVVMCLLIFFLIVGKLATIQGPAVNLPGTAFGRPDEQRAVIIVIARDSGAQPGALEIDLASLPTDASTLSTTPTPALRVRIAVDGEAVDDEAKLVKMIRERADALHAELVRATPSLSRNQVPVQVRADRDLAYAGIVPVLRACKGAGLIAVRLVTERTP